MRKRLSLHPLAYELARSRRHGRSFALIAIDVSREARARPRWHHDEQGSAVLLLRALLRSTDSIWMQGGSAILLLPETNLDGVASFAHRLSMEIPHLLRADDLSYAIFPDDGLTSGALLSTLGPAVRSSLPASTASDGGTPVSGVVPPGPREAPLAGTVEDRPAGA